MGTSLSLLLTVLLVSGAAPSNQQEQLKAADSYCAAIEQYTQHASNQKRRFGDNGQGWREYFDDDESFYDAAYVWSRKSKIVAVNLSRQNESGDWIIYLNHCFRADGSLARVKIVFNTFQGNMSVEREMIYDSRGTELRKRTKYLDLNTRKPRTPGSDFMEHEFKAFKTTKELPFRALLQPENYSKKPRPQTGL